MKCTGIEVWQKGTKFYARSYMGRGTAAGPLTAKTKKRAVAEAKAQCPDGTLVYLGQNREHPLPKWPDSKQFWES